MSTLGKAHEEDRTAALADELHAARSIVVFTGAGVSTESGIADFRSPGGIWSKIKPIQFDDYLRDPQQRLEDWRRRFHFQQQFESSDPNEGHLAVASIINGESGLGLVTQNIDGLHQRAGVNDTDMVELHGNGTRASCLDCRAPMSLEEAKNRIDREGQPPNCQRCGGIVKPNIISFGQPMPADKLALAERWAHQCDLFVVLGSSLVVQPAATLPLIAQQSGARLVIVNAQPTPLDAVADLVLQRPIGATLVTALSHVALKPQDVEKNPGANN
ncbi:MAG: NAD-dependent deacetylase [Ahrensia sp.]|nr:NAD-dependent deacetylase [Ahrensia sp.]